MATAVLSQSPSQRESFCDSEVRSHHAQNASCSTMALMQIQHHQHPSIFHEQQLSSYMAVNQYQLQHHDSDYDLDSSGDHSYHSDTRRSSISSSSWKNVRFSIQPTKIIPHIHLNDMSEEEVEATWMTYEDKTRFRREATLTKKLVRRGTIFNDNNNFNYSDDSSASSFSSSSDDDKDAEIELCYRGLEGRRHKLISMTRRVVFSVQQKHRTMQQKYLEQSNYDCDFVFGYNDNYESVPENDLKYRKMIKKQLLTIADRYKTINQDAAILARERARQDCYEASRC